MLHRACAISLLIGGIEVWMAQGRQFVYLERKENYEENMFKNAFFNNKVLKITKQKSGFQKKKKKSNHLAVEYIYFNNFWKRNSYLNNVECGVLLIM